MKRFLLVLCLLTVATNATAGRIEYGLKGGLCLSSQDFDLFSGTEFETSQRIGPEFGFFIELYPPKAFSVAASAMITERGMKSDLALSPAGKGQVVETTNENNNISYVSLAVCLKKRFNMSQRKFYFLLGPRLDIRYGSGGHEAITTVYDDSERLVPGLSGGIGWEINLKRRKRIFLELIYNYDLTDAYSDSDLTIRNRSLSVLAGLKI